MKTSIIIFFAISISILFVGCDDQYYTSEYDLEREIFNSEYVYDNQIYYLSYFIEDSTKKYIEDDSFHRFKNQLTNNIAWVYIKKNQGRPTKYYLYNSEQSFVSAHFEAIEQQHLIRSTYSELNNADPADFNLRRLAGNVQMRCYDKTDYGGKIRFINHCTSSCMYFGYPDLGDDCGGALATCDNNDITSWKVWNLFTSGGNTTIWFYDRKNFSTADGALILEIGPNTVSFEPDLNNITGFTVKWGNRISSIELFNGSFCPNC